MTASQRKPRQASGGEQFHAQLLGLKVLRFPVFFPPSLPSCFLSISFFFRIVREIDSDQKRMCHNLTLIPCIMCVGGTTRLDAAVTQAIKGGRRNDMFKSYKREPTGCQLHLLP